MVILRTLLQMSFSDTKCLWHLFDVKNNQSLLLATMDLIILVSATVLQFMNLESAGPSTFLILKKNF